MVKNMNRSVLSQLWASVLVNALYAMKNYPIMLVYTFFAPVSFLLVITLVSHGALIGTSVEGALIMTMVLSGISLQGDLSHLKNDMHVQDMVVSSPTTSLVYLAGMAIAELVYSIPALVLLLILAYFYIPASLGSALVILLVMLIMFMFSTAMGFMLSTFTSDIIQNWAFSGILSTFLSTIPPVYYPITYIPLPFRYIAYLSPTTYAAEIAQSAAGYLSISPTMLAIDWIVLIAISLALFAVASKKSRWREL